MIKIRNKRIALSIVLTMLFTMFAGIGTASSSDNIDVSSGWRFVTADSTHQNIGDIKATYNAGTTFSGPFIVIVTFTTSGVVFSDTGTADKTFLGMTSGQTISDAYGEQYVDIDSGVTGSISADVEVLQQNGTLYNFDETESQIVAKVDGGASGVTVAKKATVEVGTDQKGSAITAAEYGPTAWDSNETITYSIQTSGVTWDNNAADYHNFTDGTGNYIPGMNPDRDTDKKLTANFGTSAQYAEKCVFIPYFKIAPTVADGTEIKVKVSGDGIDATTVVVGVVGTNDVAVKVSGGDKDTLYRGQFATLDDVSIKLNPGGSLDTQWQDGDWFSVTLPAGAKFQNENAIADDSSNVSIEGFYDSNRTAWFTVDGDTTDTVKLSDFALVADSNAAVGDLNVTFKGAVEGTYKIGTIASAFTVTTTPFALTTGLTGIQGSDIVIKETADGALKSYDNDSYVDFSGDTNYYDYFDVTLPTGMTFVGTPEVEVTDGDLAIDTDSVWIGEDYRDLYFAITDESSTASTITISGLEYSVLNQPGIGDQKAQIGATYNVASDKSLESLALGAVSTNPTAVYVIGAPTFTVNGAVTSVVAPSYVKNNRTYLAIRDITAGLGIDATNVLWDEANQRVTMIKGDKIVQVTLGSNTMYVNGTAIAMDVAPEMGPTFRSMLPAAFIAQAFGATASWDGLTSTVTIK